MNSNDNENINKIKFCAAFILMPCFIIIVLFLIIASGIGDLFPREKLRISSNAEIVAKYQKCVHSDSLFLNQLVMAFININYTDNSQSLRYSFKNYTGGTHKLLRGHKDLSDTFPKIREIMKKRFPNADSYFYISYNNNIVTICLNHSLFNQTEQQIMLLYSLNRNQIIMNYPSYIIYDSVLPKEKDGWLYNFDNNWYICSPKSPRISE